MNVKDLIGQTLRREFRAEIQPLENDRVRFSFASEEPVERWWGKEIIKIDDESFNISRQGTMPWLFNHNPDIQLGINEAIEIVDGKAYCVNRWSKKNSIRDYKQDFEDGILVNVSYAYQIDEITESKESPNTYLCNVTVLEVSSVTVPADNTIGVGRSLSEDILTNNQEGKPMADKTVTIEQFREEETKRIAGIQFWLNKGYGTQQLAENFVASGESVEAFKAACLDAMQTQTQTPVAKPVNPLGFNEKEEKSYSLLRAIQACVDNDWSAAPFERECSQEIAKRTGKTTSGFYVPVRDLKFPSSQQRATYAVGADATGGYTVETDLLAENFIDFLYNQSALLPLGITMLSGLQGNVDIPGQDTTATTYWVDEGNAVTQSEATFRQVPLRPKTIGTYSKYTRLTLLQSSIDIERFIRRDFARQVALGIDKAIINGAGGSEPVGLLNTPGIGSVALGTDGAAPDWDAIVNLETEVAIDNADINTCYYVTNAKARGKLKRTQKFPSTNGDPIWEVNGMTNYINGYMSAMSNQIPSNLTKGAGTNLSAILFGDFSQVLMGEWGILEVLVNPYGSTENDFAAGTVSIRALQTLDINYRHVESFAAITDAVTT